MRILNDRNKIKGDATVWSLPLVNAAAVENLPKVRSEDVEEGVCVWLLTPVPEQAKIDDAVIEAFAVAQVLQVPVWYED